MKQAPYKSSIQVHAGSGPVVGSFRAAVRAEGGVAKISLIGTIYSGWTDEDFRAKCEKLVSEGVTSAHVYINSNGGDVFAANEIVNIIKMFKGSITGEGGAIVASAATYIAVHLSSFKMASNGQFMIHKPYAYVSGNAAELKKAVELLESFEQSYADAYAKKTGKTAKEVADMYSDSDCWMSARKAVDEGFVDGIIGEEDITAETAALFAACGKHVTVTKTQQQQQFNNHSEMKTIAVLLGLSADATEDQIIQAIRASLDFKSKYEALIQVQQHQQVQAKAVRIKEVLDGMVASRQIAADARQYYQGILESSDNFDAKVLELQAFPKPQSLTVAPRSVENADVKSGRENWTFDDWQSKDPQGLRAMHKDSYDAFNALYQAKFGSKAPVFG